MLGRFGCNLYSHCPLQSESASPLALLSGSPDGPGARERFRHAPQSHWTVSLPPPYLPGATVPFSVFGGAPRLGDLTLKFLDGNFVTVPRRSIFETVQVYHPTRPTVRTMSATGPLSLRFLLHRTNGKEVPSWRDLC